MGNKYLLLALAYIVVVAGVNGASEPIASAAVERSTEPTKAPVAEVKAVSEVSAAPTKDETKPPPAEPTKTPVAEAKVISSSVASTNTANATKINYTWKETITCCPVPDVFTKESRRSFWLKAKAEKANNTMAGGNTTADNATKLSTWKDRGCNAEHQAKFLNLLNPSGVLDMAKFQLHLNEVEKNNSKWTGVTKDCLTACLNPDSIAYPVKEDQNCKSGMNEMKNCIVQQMIMKCPAGVKAADDTCNAIIARKNEDSEKRLARIKDQRQRKIARDLKLFIKTSTTTTTTTKATTKA